MLKEAYPQIDLSEDEAVRALLKAKIDEYLDRMCEKGVEKIIYDNWYDACYKWAIASALYDRGVATVELVRPYVERLRAEIHFGWIFDNAWKVITAYNQGREH